MSCEVIDCIEYSNNRIERVRFGHTYAATPVKRIEIIAYT